MELNSQAEELVGHPVMLSSPLKVSQVLFNELKLESPGKKNKKGATKFQSTSEAVLKPLSAVHPLPKIVLGTLE